MEPAREMVRQCPCDPFGSGATARPFLALNDSTAGFLATTDAIVEITGYSGSLANLAVV